MRRLGSTLSDPKVLTAQWNHTKGQASHIACPPCSQHQSPVLWRRPVNWTLGRLTPGYKTPVTLAGAPLAWGGSPVPLDLCISHLLHKHHPHSVLSQRKGSGGKWFQPPPLNHPFLQKLFYFSSGQTVLHTMNELAQTETCPRLGSFLPFQRY